MTIPTRPRTLQALTALALCLALTACGGGMLPSEATGTGPPSGTAEPDRATNESAASLPKEGAAKAPDEAPEGVPEEQPAPSQAETPAEDGASEDPQAQPTDEGGASD